MRFVVFEMPQRQVRPRILMFHLHNIIPTMLHILLHLHANLFREKQTWETCKTATQK